MKYFLEKIFFMYILFTAKIIRCKANNWSIDEQNEKRYQHNKLIDPSIRFIIQVYTVFPRKNTMEWVVFLHNFPEHNMNSI